MALELPELPLPVSAPWPDPVNVRFFAQSPEGLLEPSKDIYSVFVLLLVLFPSIATRLSFVRIGWSSKSFFIAAAMSMAR